MKKPKNPKNVKQLVLMNVKLFLLLRFLLKEYNLFIQNN